MYESNNRNVENRSLLDEKLKKIVKKKKKDFEKYLPEEPKNLDKDNELIQDLIPVWTIIHLTAKAKHNDILTGKQRHALYKISKLKAQKIELSDKQEEYLESILKEAINQGIVEAPCEKTPCFLCDELKNILTKKQTE